MLLGLPLLGAIFAAIVASLLCPLKRSDTAKYQPNHTQLSIAPSECVEEAAAVHHHRLAPYQDGDERQRCLAPSPDPEIRSWFAPRP